MTVKRYCDNCKREMGNATVVFEIGNRIYSATPLQLNATFSPIADLCKHCIILGIKKSLKPKGEKSYASIKKT